MLPRSYESGLRIINSFLMIDLIASGTSLSLFQSPPPITLPALAVAIPIFSFKKDLLYEENRVQLQL